ncbi:thioredoxin-domain-containing protein [Trichodelitschia bisporula]|uniref:Thioredoxin-domain-containing protein n=1 Tax=Trichodelitschia bisporula TaxID=703511 RepID=A0A6G1HLE9_9PEZI|nr:thioredoxin-domain-containing protein [Trichodelitschia bisporula]
MALISVNSHSQFQSLLSANTYVVVDFYATWCPPCKVIAPVYEQLAKQFNRPGALVFAKVDVDAQAAIARQYGITAMPTFMVLKNGQVQETIRGANPPALQAAIRKAVADAPQEAPKQQEEASANKEGNNEETVSGSYTVNKGSGWKMSLR